jgi:tetratricopeptide (TPR) repeat protein
MLGSILSESEDVKEAFKYFKIAIKNNPELVEAWVKRGILYSNEGNTKRPWLILKRLWRLTRTTNWP